MDTLAVTLMKEFADETGVSGRTQPRRYLWTDAFAVCNFLGLARKTGDGCFQTLARELVDQVHHILGRHRDDDSRRGWISGLSEEEGGQHPTRGGLRIGKKLNERASHEPPDSQLEWDQDGQYFHYLTKWMHALYRMSRETGTSCYLRWAAELADTAHRAFTREMLPNRAKRIAWKMSIDLSRPLVSSSGQHDPLDGLVTCLELQTDSGLAEKAGVDLTAAIADMAGMCSHAHWATDDPLGIGGLLDDATRLAQLVFERDMQGRQLLRQLLVDAEHSLQYFTRSSLLDRPAGHRLAFRELGLSIGLQGLNRILDLAAHDHELSLICNRLMPYQQLGERIRSFWCDPAHRCSSTWVDHHDINAVMLATSLESKSYLEL